MKRRDFVKTAIASVPTLSMQSLAAKPKRKTKLKVIVLNTDWGYKGSIDQLCSESKAAGFDGIETWWSHDAERTKNLFDALQKHEMHVGFLTAGRSDNPVTHLNTFKESLNAATDQQSQKPLYVNCHSGKDFFSFEENSKLIAYTLEKTAKTGIEVFHETHRSRMCFAAHITKNFLEKYEDMKLTLDISHWVNVHESMLESMTEIVEKALQRTGHIHARVGHPEGPQVNDPRAPEWKEILEQHLAWWDEAIQNREASGAEQITFLTEFGPPSYLPTLPYTQQPVADQWAINVFMKNLIKERYM